jgi:hypothetical protein
VFRKPSAAVPPDPPREATACWTVSRIPAVGLAADPEPPPRLPATNWSICWVGVRLDADPATPCPASDEATHWLISWVGLGYCCDGATELIYLTPP